MRIMRGMFHQLTLNWQSVLPDLRKSGFEIIFQGIIHLVKFDSSITYVACDFQYDFDPRYTPNYDDPGHECCSSSNSNK